MAGVIEELAQFADLPAQPRESDWQCQLVQPGALIDNPLVSVYFLSGVCPHIGKLITVLDCNKASVEVGAHRLTGH